MNHVRGIVFFALLAVGCTGFDLQLSDVSEARQPPSDVSADDDAGVSDAEASADASDKLDIGLSDAGPKSYVVSTLAGTGAAGAADGPGSEASFYYPEGIAIGPDGSLYVADNGNHKIRKIAADGTVSAYAGTGDRGLADGPCTTAIFNNPTDVAVDAVGNLYVTEWGNGVIRKIYPTPCKVITLAGGGTSSALDGAGTAASFGCLTGLTLDTSGNIYVADFSNNRIRKVTPEGNVTTIAGTGQGRHTDGLASSAAFSWPQGIVMNAVGTLYVTEEINNDIREITDGQVTTLAGSGATGPMIDGMGTDAAFYYPNGIAIDANGNLLVADAYDNAIRQVTPAGEVTTIAGTDVKGANDGPADTATFNQPNGVAIDSNGVIYIADSANNKIRKIELK
ncbi:MAG: NHL repeat-containing protein [Polyangiaceae bacterium]|nr:NHL repeat-containing protein [Polyangiaceae bacterium]